MAWHRVALNLVRMTAYTFYYGKYDRDLLDFGITWALIF